MILDVVSLIKDTNVVTHIEKRDVDHGILHAEHLLDTGFSPSLASS